MNIDDIKQRLKGETQAHDPTNHQILALEQRLQVRNDEIRDLKAKLRATSRRNGIFEALADELGTYVKALPPFPKKPIKPSGRGMIDEDLVLHLSDEHADQLVLPHRVGGLESYNFEVVLARAERLVQSTLDYTQDTLSNYRFENLYIFANGDHINGEIHDSTNHSQYRNAFRNAMAVGQLHALMIRDLSPYFKKVIVVYTSGNHGRRSPKKDYRGAWNNWDYLVGEFAKRCITNDNVEFLIPDSFSVNVEIKGWVFNISHGDDIRGWNGLPFYSLERQSRRLMSLQASQGKQIHYFVRGHFHTLSQIAHPGGEMIINGSWKATDEYSLEAFGGYNKPTQLLHGVHAKYGVTWRLPIDLKTSSPEIPKRYKISLTDEAGNSDMEDYAGKRAPTLPS